ncbi:hypothetical protein [Nocardioides limicola]|uniref:hypothetical protein n=1 Tax=Nocardioides limicola TaxID=2803368 RepID=UPI00193C74D1|nr:hypothetical protein [Nocardioides sp. DJM-14]
MTREHHRPIRAESEFFEGLEGGHDPAQARAAADLAATVLVRGARATADPGVAERLQRLAETEGLETLAELWSGAPAESLAGCLWRLYVLRSWVYGAPDLAAEEFSAGRHRSDVARVVAGVPDPPHPDEVRTMIDEVLRGIAEREFADVLFRAAAFAHVVAVGRARTGHDGAERLLTVAEQLEAAGHLELAGSLS